MVFIIFITTNVGVVADLSLLDSFLLDPVSTDFLQIV